MTKPTSMNYAAMADAIRKERIGERIEHLRALTHICDAAELSGNYRRSAWAFGVWVAVFQSIANVRPKPKGHTPKFQSGGVYIKSDAGEHIIPKHITTKIKWND